MPLPHVAFSHSPQRATLALRLHHPQDGIAVNPEMAVQVRDCAGLAEMFDAECADALSANPTKP